MKRTLYDRACRGWTPTDPRPLFESHPVAVGLILVLPVLVLAELAVLAVNGR